MFYQRLHATFVGVVATLVTPSSSRNLPGTGCTGFCIATRSQPSAGPSDPSLFDLWPSATHAGGRLPRRYR